MIRPMSALGTYIRHRRVKILHRTLEEVATKSGLSAGALSMIETGKRHRISPDTVVKLALGLDDTPENVFRAAVNGDGPANGNGDTPEGSDG